MNVQTQEGKQAIPRLPSGEGEALSRALTLLAGRKLAWVGASIRERIALLERITHDFLSVADDWVMAGARAKGVQSDRHALGQEWGSGPLEIVRLLAALKKSLLDIERYGAPLAPIGVRRGKRGPQTTVRALPALPYDRLSFMGTVADVWLQPGITPEDVPHLQAPTYSSKGAGGVSLVLGAGNVSSIAVTDTLEKLFVHDQVVLLKLNPVNAYLAPFIEKALSALIEAGFLHVVEGGAEVGAYLCEQPLVDSIHVTGSSRTFDAIVFGAGEEGRARKARREARLQKPITGELNDISPVIVVPGPWSASDLQYHAHYLASMLSNQAGFTCATPRLIVQHASWPSQKMLLEALERFLAGIPLRAAYYPGAHERWQALVEAHPEARRIGEPREGELPWTLIPSVDPDEDGPCFREEPFCGLTSEVALEAESSAAFLDKAVEFVNERLWGTLSVAVFIHPASRRDPAVAAALRRAIENLRYGTISINHWTAMGWSSAVTPWGAYPGSELHEVRSGVGFMHNPLMLAGIEKTVLRAPFRLFPLPPWFALYKRYDLVARQLVHLNAMPSPGKAARLVASVLRGVRDLQRNGQPHKLKADR